MLHSNCAICVELFTPTANVQVTKCGHLFHNTCLEQWLLRSKTCPQCRNKCSKSNTFRVYFNTANLGESSVDVGALTAQLDDVHLQLKLREKDCNQYEQLNKNLKAAYKRSLEEVHSLENEMDKYDYIVINHRRRNALLQARGKLIDELRDKIVLLEQQNETMRCVTTVLSTTNLDAEKVLQTESDPKKLALLVATFTRELPQAKREITQLNAELNAMHASWRKMCALTKTQKGRIAQLERENAPPPTEERTMAEIVPEAAAVAPPALNSAQGAVRKIKTNLAINGELICKRPRSELAASASPAEFSGLVQANHRFTFYGCSNDRRDRRELKDHKGGRVDPSIDDESN